MKLEFDFTKQLSLASGNGEMLFSVYLHIVYVHPLALHCTLLCCELLNKYISPIWGQ